MVAYIYELASLEVISKVYVRPGRGDVFDEQFEKEYGSLEYDYTYDSDWFFANARKIVFETNHICKKLGLKEYDGYGFL